jgi:hypothetical protein
VHIEVGTECRRKKVAIPMMKELFETSPTTELPEGATPLKVTVPVDVPPFAMVVGFNVSDERISLLHVPPPVFGVSL